MNDQRKLYQIAFGLAVFTIMYNLGEGMLSTWLGFRDESLALFGFGVDSFIEVISGLGIAHMIIRIRRHPESERDPYERTALKITGTAFYLLVAGLIVTGIHHLVTHERPVATGWGVVIASISILVMLGLVYAKRRVGRALHSSPILADANCTMICVYMSIVLLVSSGLYALFSIPFIDVAGSFGLAWFAWNEGKECFEKARTGAHCACD